MQTLTCRDVNLSVLALGPDTGRPVIFLHGLISGNMASWYSPIALPISATRRVVLYDLRGHGESTTPSAGYDLDQQMHDLIAVINALGEDAHVVDVVGHSMGALIALHFALRHPERVGRLVLVDAPMPANHWVSPSLLAVKSEQDLVDWIQTRPDLASARSGRRAERLRLRMTKLFFETSIVADVLAMGPESEALLANYTKPVELIYGRQSPCLEAGYELRRLLPHARLVLLNCGHYIPMEQPDDLRELLTQLLESETESLGDATLHFDMAEHQYPQPFGLPGF